METAIATSMGACGKRSQPCAPATSVIVWPMVNALTMTARRFSARRMPSACAQRPPEAISGAGSSSASRNIR